MTIVVSMLELNCENWYQIITDLRLNDSLNELSINLDYVIICWLEVNMFGLELE